MAECKYCITKMGLAVFKKAQRAAQAYKEQRKQETGEAAEVYILLVSTGGFTQELLAEIKERKDAYYSDYERIIHIFRKFGGGFDIHIVYS